MANYPFIPPDFLREQTADRIHKRMLAALPPDMDKSELSVPWDFTRPSALEKAEFVQYELNEALQIMFPHWAYGEWLDLHAQMQGLTRKPATHAFGYLEVSIRAGARIAKGFRFATAANLSPSVLFEAQKEVLADADRYEPDSRGYVTVSVPAIAVESGLEGNVPPDAIKLMVEPDRNIAYVVNPLALLGGVPQESDDDLRERVLEAIRYGISYTGCDADYVRWAKEVPGIGDAVTDPEWDDPNMPEKYMWLDGEGRRRKAGAVRVFVIDGNGQPANDLLVAAVYAHIVNPDDRMARLAPIGATVTIAAPTPIRMDVEAQVLLEAETTLEAVTERYKEALARYWIVAAKEREVKYVQIGAELAETAGAADYRRATLQVNADMENVPVELGQFPVTGEVTLYV